MSISKIIKNLFLTEDGNVYNIDSVDTDQSVILNQSSLSQANVNEAKVSLIQLKIMKDRNTKF